MEHPLNQNMFHTSIKMNKMGGGGGDTQILPWLKKALKK